MTGNGELEDDPLGLGCYSQLLLDEEITALETDCGFRFTSSSPLSDNNNNTNSETGQKFGSMSTDSLSYLSSRNDTNFATLPKTSKKRDGSGSESNQMVYGGAPTESPSKKSKSDSRTVTGHAKVAKKETLGERITLLQQLVSPFGKTDTASVLHEAFGYIRFLQDQVQVLCSPYLPHLPDDDGENRRKDDLRSRGLCLVPLELTLLVAESNGADLWSSTAMLNNISSI